MLNEHPLKDIVGFQYISLLRYTTNKQTRKIAQQQQIIIIIINIFDEMRRFANPCSAAGDKITCEFHRHFFLQAASSIVIFPF
jgi:hypothetical protein